jgi:glycosyltransferase involved in cell wall biosynthesis
VTHSVPVSVVVPTVVRPQHLGRCIEAIVRGEVTPAEIVVVDQGRSPETREVIDSYDSPQVPVHHVVSARRGLSAARNVGLRHVRSAWVAFTDDDCVPSPEWLREAVAALSRGDLDGVAGRVLPRGADDPGTFTLSLRVATVGAVYRERAYPWRVGTGGNMVLGVEALRRLGGYDERLGAGTPGAAGEDLEIVHRLLRDGATLAFEPAVVVYHDRVDADRRLATRRSYGFGMGAFAGLWIRSDPWVGIALGRWVTDRLRVAARAAARRDSWRVREERLLLAGAVAGLRYGRRLGLPLSLGAPDHPAPSGHGSPVDPHQL